MNGNLFKSRKFWAAVAGLAFAVFGARAGLSQAEVTIAVTTLVTFILGTALEDGLKAKALK